MLERVSVHGKKNGQNDEEEYWARKDILISSSMTGSSVTRLALVCLAGGLSLSTDLVCPPLHALVGTWSTE